MYEVTADFKHAVLWSKAETSMIMSKHRTLHQAEKELARIHKFIVDAELHIPNARDEYSIIELDKDKERF
jgi:hypothetical protein